MVAAAEAESARIAAEQKAAEDAARAARAAGEADAARMVAAAEAESARIAAEQKAKAEVAAAETARIVAEEQARAKVAMAESARIVAEEQAAARLEVVEARRLAAESQLAATVARKAAEDEAIRITAAAEADVAAREADVAARETARVAAEEKREADKIAKHVAELKDLATSDDFAAVCGAVKHYTGHEHPDVRTACAALVAHRNKLNQKMRAFLRKMCEDGGIADLDEALDKSEGYEGALASAISAVRGRQEQLQTAVAEMRTLGRSTDVLNIAAAIESFASLPGECNDSRQSLQSHVDTMLRAISEELLLLCSSEATEAIDAALTKYAEVSKHPRLGTTVRDAYEKLRNYRSSVTSGSADLLRSLVRSNDFVAISTALVENANGGNAETRQEWSKLQLRRQQMLARSIATCQQLVSSDDITGVKGALADYEPYLLAPSTKSGDLQALMRLLATLQAKFAMVTGAAKSELVKLVGAHYVTLSQMDSAVAKFPGSGYGEAVDSLIEALSARKEGLLAEAQEKIEHALTLDATEFATIDQVFTDYSDLVAGMDGLDKLSEHHGTLLKEGRDGLLELCGTSDVEQIDATLPQYEGYGFALDDYRSAVYKHRQALGTVNQTMARQTAELDALSETMRTEPLFRTGSAGGDMSMSMIGAPLAERRHDPATLQMMKTKLLEMCRVSTSVAAMDEALSEAQAGFGDAVRAEVASLSIHRTEIVEDILTELHSLRSSHDVARVSSCVDRHESAARRVSELSQYWTELSAHRASLVDAARNDLQNLASSADISLIDTALTKYESCTEVLAEEMAAVMQRRTANCDIATAAVANLAASDDFVNISQKLAQFPRERPLDVSPEQWQDLQARRDKLRSDAVAELQSLQGAKDLSAMERVLSRFEGWRQSDTDIQREHTSLRQAMVEAEVAIAADIVAKIDDLLRSDDLQRISRCADEFQDECPTDVRPEQWSALLRRRDGLQLQMAETLEVFQSLVLTEDLAAIGRELARHKANFYLPELQQARDELQKRFDALVDGTCSALNAATQSGTLCDFAEVLAHVNAMGASAAGSSALSAALTACHAEAAAVTDMALKYMRELQTSQDFKSIRTALDEYEGAIDPQCARCWNQLSQWKDALVGAALEEICQIADTPVYSKDIDVDAIDAALSTYEAYGEPSLTKSLADLRSHRNTLENAAADVVVQLEQLASEQSRDCMAIDAALARHRDAASPQVRAARQSLASRRMELVNDARAALVEATVAAASSSLASAMHTLAGAQQAHASCTEALPNEFAEVRAQHRALLDSALAELSAAARTTDYRHVRDVLSRAREYPSECAGPRQQLESHARALLEAARAALLAVRSSGEMGAIDESLSVASAFGEELAAEAEVTAAWRARVLTARGLISESLRSTDLEQIEQVLAQCIELGPPMAQEARALREHQERVSAHISTAVGELTALVGSEDLERVAKALMAYADQPAAPIRAACDTLQNKRMALMDALLDRARQVSSTDSSDLDEVDAATGQLETALHLGCTTSDADGNSGVHEVLRLLRARNQMLVQRRAHDIRELASSDDIVALSAAAERYSPDSLPTSLRAEGVLIQQRLAAAVSDARDKLTAACQVDDLQAMDDALQQFSDRGLGGGALSAEISALLSARERLLTTAAGDVQVLLGSTDVAALGAMYWRLEDWPGLESARDACYNRWQDLVEEGRRSMAKLAQHGSGTADLAAIDDALVTYGEWGEELLGEELRQLATHRAELIGVVRAEMSGALGGDDVAAVSEAAAEFGSGRWGGSASAQQELAGLQAALSQHAYALQQKAHSVLAQAAAASDAREIDALLAPYDGGRALSSLFPREVEAAVSLRGTMLRQAASELSDLARTCVDPALIAAHLRRCEGLPADRTVEVARGQLEETLVALLAPHRAEVWAHCRSREVLKLDVVLADYDMACARGEAVAVLLREEWEDVRTHRSALVDEARQTLRQLAGRTTSYPSGGSGGTYTAIADALSQYASFASALPEELHRCRSTLGSLLFEMKAALAAAAVGDDVSTMDALLLEAQHGGFGSAVAAEAAALERRREAVLARTLRRVESLQHSDDLSAISAVLDAADDVHAPDVAAGSHGLSTYIHTSSSRGVTQVDLLRERARALAGVGGSGGGGVATPTPSVRRTGGLELSWR